MYCIVECASISTAGIGLKAECVAHVKCIYTVPAMGALFRDIFKVHCVMFRLARISEIKVTENSES